MQSYVGCVKNRAGSILALKHAFAVLALRAFIHFACVVFLCCLRCLRSFLTQEFALRALRLGLFVFCLRCFIALLA